MRRIAVLIPLLIALAFATAPAHAAGCAGANATPTASNLTRIRTTMLCLLNQQRHAHHLSTLQRNRSLERAATHFSWAMVRQRFFDHTAPDGTTFDERIEAAGYGAYSALAENIAWGSGSESTPARIVAGWMHSPGHRRNILDGDLRNIGIGIAPGAPQDTGGQSAATYTTDFGRLR